MAIKAVPLAAIGVGALFVYSGVRGYSILKSAQNLIQGTAPQHAQLTAALVDPGHEASGSDQFGGGNFAGGIPGNAQKYVGKLSYVFGAPPPMGKVDCSSFASKVLAESGVKNPGGAPYDPRTHGPNTISYLAWRGAKTVGHKATDAQPGDLCVWQTHMGIAIGDGKMVSARSQDSNPNVGIDNIQGDMPGELLFVRRLI
jgi:cell wall-associated NlpC family hydrolase